MKTCPSCFCTPKITRFIDCLIEDGISSYQKLSDADKDTLVSYCIEELGEDAYNCLLDGDICSMLTQLKKSIQTRQKEDVFNLFEIIHNNALIHFEEPMEDLFQERLNFYNQFVRPSIMEKNHAIFEAYY